MYQSEYFVRADSMFVPSQWETLLQSKAISHWLGENLDSALILCMHPANKKRCYIVMLSLNGWMHTQMLSALYKAKFINQTSCVVLYGVMK